MLDRGDRDARAPGVLFESGQLAARRHVIFRAEQQADALVAERGQVTERLARRREVVGGDAGELEAVDRGVDQHDRHAPAAQQPVVIVRRGHLGEVTAGEHHARRVLVQQHVDVVGLGQPARSARAEHRGEAALRQRAADHLGQRGENGVLQFGQHEADEPGALAPQLARALVPEHVKRGEHRVPGAVGDARLAVEHPAHGGLAGPDLLRHVGHAAGRSSRHAAKIRHLSESYSHFFPHFRHVATVIKLCLFIRSSTSCKQMSGNVSCS